MALDMPAAKAAPAVEEMALDYDVACKKSPFPNSVQVGGAGSVWWVVEACSGEGDEQAGS